MNTARTYILLFMLFCTGVLKAQQAPMFTHYMYNTLAVNPAYAGTRDALTTILLHRNQWVGLPGAPVTQTFTMHTPVFGRNMGLGVSVLSDAVGPLKNTCVSGDFAYRLRLDEKSQIAFGLKATMDVMNIALTSVALSDQADNAFQSDINSKVRPNFGAGFYYFRDRFYAGVSTPRLIENSYNLSGVSNVATVHPEARHYFFIAGSVFKISENLLFKPTTFIKATAAAPFQADLTSSFIIDKHFVAGVMVRTGDALGVLAGYDINDQFHVGYSFDWSYGIRTLKKNSGSHEFILTYDFIYKDKQKVRSPRYF